MKRWRLILDTARGAAENMAIDEAIMLSCARGSASPTVRIYSWSRPSVSLGCLQPLQDAQFDIDYCRSEGIDVVRRITGGRAVIHGSDVTFSIVLGEHDLPEGCSSVLASHRWLMGGVVSGLRLLGIDAELGESSGARDALSGADCFGHIAECDVRVGRRKVVGSAQVRRSGAILEQGSIPFAAPGFDASRVFSKPNQPVTERDIPLAGFTYRAIEQALARGFGGLLQGSIEQGMPSPDEARLADELARDKYLSPDWTARHNLGDTVELVR